MKTKPNGIQDVQQILERNAAELRQLLRNRDGIAIEKSADQMDEIQFAAERDLATRNADRESRLLREIKAALDRLHEGRFGTCIECEAAISAKRIAALPWAPFCIECQEAADRNGESLKNGDGERLADVA